MQPTSEHRTPTSQWLGRAASPLISLGNSIRESRVFQPTGICFHALVTPKRGLPSHFRNLANRLSGDALVRLSGGLWQSEHRLLPDVLNCSIRFKAWPPMEEPTDDAQDLVLLSTRAPWALAIDSFKTNQHDFLLNQYYSLAPLEIDGRSNISLRLIPNVEPGPGRTREEKIRAAVNAGDVILDLQIRENDRGTDWKPLLEIRLRQEVQVDADSLRFWPFRAGQGLRPQGWLEYLQPIPTLLDRLGNQAEAATDSALHNVSERTKRRSRPLGQVIADTTVLVVNGALSALDKTQQVARKTRNLADKLLNKTLRSAQTSATDATLLATAGAEIAQNSVQEAVQETVKTTQAATEQVQDNLRHARQATRQATSRASDRALELGNRAGEAVSRTSAELQQTGADIGTRAAEAGARITEETSQAAQDIGRRTQESAVAMAEEPAKPRRRRNRSRSKAKKEEQSANPGKGPH